jgi:hypothetical protein
MAGQAAPAGSAARASNDTLIAGSRPSSDISLGYERRDLAPIFQVLDRVTAHHSVAA